VGLDLFPEILVDDAQVWDFGLDQLACVVEPRKPSACIRILTETLAVEQDAAPVEFVVEKPVALFVAAGNRIGAPHASSRRRHTLGIEPMRDGEWACAFGVFREDSAYDRCLVFIYFAQAIMASMSRRACERANLTASGNA
jgi:hypothetical protein